MNKNLYIVEEVLSDYTSGMVVMIASNLDECRSMFIEELGCSYSDFWVNEYDKAIEKKKYKVIPVSDNEETRIVSYAHGGA